MKYFFLKATIALSAIMVLSATISAQEHGNMTMGGSTIKAIYEIGL